MFDGVPKEIKNHEYRIGLFPAGVREFVQRSHAVLVEKKRVATALKQNRNNVLGLL
jgi:alanine dehydrogenase